MKITFTFLLSICMTYIAYAQEREEISPILQKEIIQELGTLIEREYILEEEGSKMVQKLNELNEKGRSNLASEDFLKEVNELLQSVYRDKHLGVVNPERFKMFQEMFGIQSNEDANHEQPEGHGPEKASQHGQSHVPEKISTHHGPEKAKNHNEGHGPEKATQHGQNHGPEKKPEHHGPEKAEGHGGHGPENHGQKQANDPLWGSRVINRDGRTNIALLKINQFDGSEQGIKRMEGLMSSFKDTDAVIIDLRSCKGGDADMVRVLSGYFFKKETYLATSISRKDANGNRATSDRYSIVQPLSEQFHNKPLYIMTSQETFSAAESFTFGMELNGRATIIGSATGGGGHMNDFFPLPGGYGVSISVGRTYNKHTNKGFQGTGVAPDISVEADHAFAETLSDLKDKRTKALAYQANKEKVYQTLLGLSEAWYLGDVEKAQEVLYKDYQTFLKTDGEEAIESVDFMSLIKEGWGSKTPREVRNREISIYEVRDNKSAIARLMYRDQIHYLHLINDNGDWKILSNLITKKQAHG